jgi:hypothetical protein
VDLEDVIRVVLDAGMAKTRNPDPNGKALKPAGFVPADERVRELVARVERERQAVVRSGLSFVGGDWTTAADYDAYQRERYGPGGTIT